MLIQALLIQAIMTAHGFVGGPALPTSSNRRGVARFDRFELDLDSGELRRDGANLKLQPQPAKILTLLVSRPGEVITRSEIAEEVWGSETFVDFERGLNFAISQIRAVLELTTLINPALWRLCRSADTASSLAWSK